MEIIRGIPLDEQTQQGFCGSLAQVWQQRMSDLEGRALARRWEWMTQLPQRIAPMYQLGCKLGEQLSHPNQEHALQPSRQIDTETLRSVQERALLDKESCLPNE